MKEVAKTSRKLVLSVVDSKQVEQARKVLDDLEAKINVAQKQSGTRTDIESYRVNMDEIFDLSNAYYELLSPTGFAYSSIPPILNPNQVQEQRQMLQDLYDIEVAFKILIASKQRVKELHPFDYCVSALNVDMKVLKEGTDEEFETVGRYVEPSYKIRIGVEGIRSNLAMHLESIKFILKVQSNVSPSAVHRPAVVE